MSNPLVTSTSQRLAMQHHSNLQIASVCSRCSALKLRPCHACLTIVLREVDSHLVGQVLWQATVLVDIGQLLQLILPHLGPLLGTAFGEGSMPVAGGIEAFPDCLCQRKRAKVNPGQALDQAVLQCMHRHHCAPAHQLVRGLAQAAACQQRSSALKCEKAGFKVDTRAPAPGAPSPCPPLGCPSGCTQRCTLQFSDSTFVSMAPGITLHHCVTFQYSTCHNRMGSR